MDKTIIYSSKYGTTQAYAEKLGQHLQLPALSLDEVNQAISKPIIYLAPVYFGQVKDLKKLLSYCTAHTQLTLILNGLYDYANGEKRDELEAQLLTILDSASLDAYTIHYLPGTIQKPKLRFPDSIILKMVEKASKAEQDVFSSFPEMPDFEALKLLVDKL